MRVVAFQAPGEVRVEERPEPEPLASDDAVVRVEATGICGSDLHIYHGRVAIEPGFVIGHEYVGTVIAAGDGVTEVAVGDRVLGTYCTACGRCFHCRRGEYHKCDSGRVFGHGATLGSLPGAQAEQVLVPSANLTLRRVPDGLSDDVALFAGDVAGTGYHAVCGDAARPQPLEPGAAARNGDAEAADRRFRRSAAVQREVKARFWLAVTLLEYAEWLSVENGVGEVEPVLAEAREIFSALEAAPWLDRLDALVPAAA